MRGKIVVKIICQLVNVDVEEIRIKGILKKKKRETSTSRNNLNLRLYMGSWSLLIFRVRDLCNKLYIP